MAGRSRGATAPFAWATIFYLLLVFLAKAVESDPANTTEDLGTVIGIDLGTTYSYVR